MAETKIEWTATTLPDGSTVPGYTFNPWIGCTAISRACDNCYAESEAKRRGWALWGNHPRHRTSENYWKQPLTWNRRAEAEGIRRKVFCASLADVFDNQVPEEWRDDLWHLIATTQHLDWLLLTKRPQNISKMLPQSTVLLRYPEWPWPHVWLGTTVENQEEADRRIPHLLAVPAKVRFLSCEPLLGPLDLQSIYVGREIIKPLAGVTWYPTPPDWPVQGITARHSPKLHWIICGGESGTGARPMHPDWARSLRDQCNAAGVPFFFKQWGEWAPIAEWGEGLAPERSRHEIELEGLKMARVGKKKAGALLDGREWREMPDQAATDRAQEVGL